MSTEVKDCNTLHKDDPKSSSSLITNSYETEACPICFEEWTNSGQHRLVSTYCGHLFGKICIEKWLRTSPTCPQCQSTAKRRDLRRIYCRAIQVLDTSERDNALRERDLERKVRRKLEHEKAELQLSYDNLQEHCRQLQADHDRLSKLAQHLDYIREPTTVASLPSIQIQLDTVLQIPAGMCRVLAYIPSHQWLLVSQSTNSNSQSDYGIKKISLINGVRTLEYLPLDHTKPIRDMQVHGDLLLSCAWDKTLRIFDYIQKTSKLRCECSSQVWSCAWNLDDPNLIYAGLNSGRVQVFDQRQVRTDETTLSSSIETLNLASASPILCLQYIQKNGCFQSSGLLVGSNDKSGFYEYTSNCEYHLHDLPIDRNLSSLSYDPASNRLLASFRPSENPTRHELYELIIRPNQSFNISLQLIRTFHGSSVNIVLSRSKIVHRNLETYVVASDNRSHGIQVWNSRQPVKTPSFQLSTQCDIVDLCLTRQYLCLLADNQIRMYKWA